MLLFSTKTEPRMLIRQDNSGTDFEVNKIRIQNKNPEKQNDMKTLTHSLPAAVISLSCVVCSGQQTVYTFPFENNMRLQHMKTSINQQETANSYQTVGNIYTTEFAGPGEETVEQTSTLFISDARMMDAVRFLETYMEEELIAPGLVPDGSCEMSIIYYDEYNRFNIGGVVAVLTFGIALMLGVPYETTVVDIEVEAEFKNQLQFHQATHRGTGRAKKMKTLYSSSTRKTHQKALRKAICNLNESILADSELPKVPVN
jgi:hypothetical protein